MSTPTIDQCINERCPWSGEPVQADSLTFYHGQVVGFCSPGCKEKFERAVRLFEQSARGDAYFPRAVCALEAWKVGAQPIKVYGISVAGRPPLEPERIDAARRYVEDVLPAAAEAEGDVEGPGFCIIHEGELGTWLLIDWWAHGDICCQRMAFAAPGPREADFVSVDDRPLHACVWEQIVINHERNAWVRHAMSKEPRNDRYLQDQLSDGLY